MQIKKKKNEKPIKISEIMQLIDQLVGSMNENTNAFNEFVERVQKDHTAMMQMINAHNGLIRQIQGQILVPENKPLIVSPFDK